MMLMEDFYESMDCLINDLIETADIVAKKDFCPPGCLTYDLYQKYGHYSSYVYVLGENNKPDNKYGFINFFQALSAARLNGLFPAYADLFADDIILVKNLLHDEMLNEEMYQYVGKYKVTHILSCFSSWENALVYSKKKELRDTLPRPLKKRKCRISIGERKRYLVFQRDNFTCVACGASPRKNPNVELQVDHIKPVAKGGTNELDNLQTLCSVCNRGKSDIYEY